jgi:hypothetical protein
MFMILLLSKIMSEIQQVQVEHQPVGNQPRITRREVLNILKKLYVAEVLSGLPLPSSRIDGQESGDKPITVRSGGLQCIY